MSAYFVVTALTTVRPASNSTRLLDRLALGVAVALTLFDIALGITALQRQAAR